MTRTLKLVSVLLLIAVSAPALGWAMWQEIKPGHVYPKSRDGKPPAGLEELMNFKGRVSGEDGFFSEIGSWQILHFGGDSIVFNDFLQRYAKLGIKPVKVHIRKGPGMLTGIRGIQEPEGAPYDWALRWDVHGTKGPVDAEGRKIPYSLSVTLWTGGQVKLDQVKWPKSIEVVKETARPKRLDGKSDEAVDGGNGPASGKAE